MIRFLGKIMCEEHTLDWNNLKQFLLNDVICTTAVLHVLLVMAVCLWNVIWKVVNSAWLAGLMCNVTVACACISVSYKYHVDCSAIKLCCMQWLLSCRIQYDMIKILRSKTGRKAACWFEQQLAGVFRHGMLDCVCIIYCKSDFSLASCIDERCSLYWRPCVPEKLLESVLSSS